MNIAAILCVIASIALAFTSLLISVEHDIAAGVLMTIAQLLVFAGTVFGIDYKFSLYDITKRNQK